MKKTLFTKVIKDKDYVEKQKFLFEELKLDEERNFESLELQLHDVPNDIKIDTEQAHSDKNIEEKIDIESIIAQIRGEYEARLAEEYQRGFREAEKFLKERMNDELKEQISRIDQFFKNFSSEVENLEKMLESVVISLAIEIAKKIVKREIEKNDDFVITQVRDAIKRVIGVERIRLRINPEDEKLIKELKSDFLQVADSMRDIIVEPDPNIERGGCIIESELGNVDARISTQFSLIENSLIETFNQQ